MLFKTGGPERMRIDTSGRVGIGTSSPSQKLVVDGNIQLGTSSGAGILYLSSSSGFSPRLQEDSNALSIYTNNSERMRIDASGNVGIGTNNPNAKLHVNGAVNSSQAQFGTSSNRPLIVRSSNAGGYADDLTEFHKNSGVGQFSFSNTGGEMMRINSSGDLLIGTTSFSAGQNSKNITPAVIYSSRNSTATSTQISFYNPNGLVGEITTNGSSTSYNTSSDYRLKENVVDLTGASARVNQLDVKRFNFIADETNTLVDGFLAHEVATVVPEAITGTKDAMRDEEYEVTPAVLDDDGNVTTEAVMGTRSVPKYQGIDQSKLVPLLTAALQEALAKIDAMETRLTALEG
jgi:hypothetical protein